MTTIGLCGITKDWSASSQSWGYLLEQARQLGVTSLHLQAPPWHECESTPGKFDLSYFDAFFKLAAGYGFKYTLDIATPLGLGEIQLPSDMGAFAGFNSTLASRYRRYVAAVLKKFKNPSHVILHIETMTVTLGNSVYLPGFIDLLKSTAQYIRQVCPNSKVGIYGNKNESPGLMVRINESMDFAGIGYIADRGDDDHAAIITKLLSESTKPRLIYEVGIPTSEKLGGSQEKQTHFVEALLWMSSAWLIDVISYYQCFDESLSSVSAYVPKLFQNYSTEQQQELIEFFTSLGLHGKPAWNTFKELAREYR